MGCIVHLHPNQCPPVETLVLGNNFRYRTDRPEVKPTVIELGGYKLAINTACCFVTKSSTPKVVFGLTGLILDSIFQRI